MRAYESTLTKSMGHNGFTLIELMVVVTILALLFAMLVPSMGTAMEYGRVSQCGSVLRNIGSAQAHYVADYNGHMQAYCWYEPVKNYDPVHNNGQYAYDYHNVLGEYLGLGDCMPQRGDNWNKASQASFSGGCWPYTQALRRQYKAFQCPSGVAPDIYCPCWGTPVGSFYMQNCWWTSQQPTTNWPAFGPYFPMFQNPGKAVLLFEHWAVCMTSNSDAVAVPYDTHFRTDSRGAVGIGRSQLYADWHVGFHKCVDGPDTYSGGGWCCGATFIPATNIQRGDEGGCICVKDGLQYVGWYGTLDSE